MAKIEELKEQYWRVLAHTRKSCRIAESVKEKSEKKWKDFDEDVVLEALQIHIDRYKPYKESYTIGIMRNLQKKKDMTGKIKNENQFNQFMHTEYDFEALEREILAN